MLDNYISYLIIAGGAIFILLSFLSPQNIIKYFIKTKNTDDENKVTINTIDKKDNFIEIVSLWYQLKKKCEQHNLASASEKLDEVFPLLSGILKDET